MKSRNELLRCHLKHLLFNDAMVTHKAGMNHNAMDRSCVYDRFLDEIQNVDFDSIYDDTLRRYWKERDEFEPEPLHLEEVPAKDGRAMTTEEIEKISMSDDVELIQVLSYYGYWKSLEDVDAYVAHYATDEAVDFLVKKIYEDQNSCQPAQDQSQPQIRHE